MNRDFHTSSNQPLLDYHNRLIPLNCDEIELVRAKFHPHLFLKKQFSLQHGNVCEHFDFVVRGCLRLSKLDEKGVYQVLQFATENYWMIDHLLNRLSQVQIASYLGVTPEFLSRIRSRMAKNDE